MRRPFIAGNWKMHKAPVEADALAESLKRALSEMTAADIAVAPTFLAIPAVVARLRHSNIGVASQNVAVEAQGAFTGEISAEMLKAAGVQYAIVGHSERRQLFGDTDAVVSKKVQACFRAGISAILCVGETLPEREAGQVEDVVARQLSAGLADLSADQVSTVTIAYEPVWAIGTGKVATPTQANDVHAYIRSWLGRYPSFVARNVRIQYGGSVKGSNAAGLLSQPEIDGALVGGAALSVEDFTAIVKAAT
jgi:triosephosphate isomerase